MKLSLIAVLLLVSVACSTKNTKKEVEAQATQEVGTKAGLKQTIHEVITNSKTLTEAQKKKIVDLLKANKDKADKLVERSFQLRSLLVKELLSDKIDYKKVSVIKKDIRQIEADRLKNTIDAIEGITRLVSKNPEHIDDFSRHLINIGPASL